MSDSDYRKREKTPWWGWVLLALILGGISYAKAAESWKLGHKETAHISVCVDLEAADAMMSAEKEGQEVAEMSFALLSAFGICGNATLEFTPKKVVSTHDSKRGKWRVVEIDVQGKPLYMLTRRAVLEGEPV